MQPQDQLPTLRNANRRTIFFGNPAFLRAAVALTLFAAITAFAEDQESPSLPPVVERYEQMLVRSPEKGTAFDKVYQHFFENEGLEKLATRWRGKATGSDAPVYDLLLGLLLERQGKPAEARAAYTDATKLSPDDYRTWRALGELEAAEGKMPQAIDALQKALGCKVPTTERAELYRHLAQSQQRNMETEAALATWQKMASEFPDDPFVLEEVADAQADAEKFDDAKASYTKLRDLAGADPFKKVSAIIKLAELQERQGNFKDALKIYESALPEASETSWIHREVRSRIEEIYRRQDDLLGLISYYQKWMASHDKDIEAATRLSNALIEVNRKKEAVQWIQKAADLAPDRREIQIQLAKILRETDQPEAALKILKKLTENFDDELSYWEMQGEIQWQLFEKNKDPKLKADALASWAKLAPADSKDVATVIHLADLLRSHDLADDALTQYKRACDIAPDATDLRERLVSYYLELKRNDDAWKVAAEIVAGNRATAENYLRLATIQSKYGKPDAAMDSIAKGLALDPKNYPLLAQKWRLLTDQKEWGKACELYGPMMAASPAMYEDIESEYLQALRGNNTLDAKKAELQSKLTSLDENSVRLLLRLSLQTDDLEAAKPVIEEANKRFPKSSSIALLEADYQRRSGNTAARVATLRKLIQLEPKHATDYLKEIARAHQEHEDWDKALAAADELLKLNPASTDSQSFYASLCFAAGKRDEGIAKLREAIKLSEKPNQFRLWLARVYQENSDLSSAQRLLEEAFQTEEDNTAKLSILRQLTDVYSLQGNLDQLISKFRDQERGDGNTKYAVYLSAIFQQMHDSHQAKEELAKVLASRPADPQLLRQLISLADEDGDLQAKVKYYQSLVELEPSVANRVELAKALADSDNVAGAAEIIKQNLPDFLKDPEPWKEVLSRVQKDDSFDVIRKELERTIEQRPDDFKTKLVIAEVEIAAGKLDSAIPVLWDIYRMPQPQAAPAASPTPAPGPTAYFNPGLPVSSFTTNFQQRLFRTNQSKQRFDELLATSSRGYAPNRYRRYAGFPINFPGAAAPAKPSLVEEFKQTQDCALVYLAAIGLKQDKPAQFLSDLTKLLDDENADNRMRLQTYALVQAQDAFLNETEKWLKSGAKDPDLDQFCLSQLTPALYRGTPNIDPRIADMLLTLVDRLNATDPTKQPYAYLRWTLLRKLGKDDEAKKVLAFIIHKADDGTLASLQAAVQIEFESGETEKLEEHARKILQLQKNAKQGHWGYSGASVIQSLIQNRVKKGIKDITPLMVEWFQWGLPVKPSNGFAAPTFTFISGYPSTSNLYDSTPFPNRYFNQSGRNQLQQIYGFAKQAKCASSFCTALNALDVPKEQKIYVQLATAYLQWWDDQKEKALETATKALSENPDDELRLFVAGMQSELKRPSDVLKTLDQIRNKQTPVFKKAIQLEYTAAKELKNVETQKKIALEMLSAHLQSYEIQQVLNDLKDLGLEDKVKQYRQASNGYNSSRNNVSPGEAMRRMMIQYRRDKKEKEALEIAKAILAKDPFSSSSQYNNNNDRQRSDAIATLTEFQALDDYLAGLEKQLNGTPSDFRIYVALGEGCLNKDAKKAVHFYQKAADLRPHDSQVLLRLAEVLQRRDQADEAIAIYNKMFDQDPAEFLQSNYDLIGLYKKAKKLDQLAEYAIRCPVPPSSGFTSYRGSPVYEYERLGKELQTDKKTDLVLGVWKRGIEIAHAIHYFVDDMERDLAAALLDAGKDKEARALINEHFFPAVQPVPPLLGNTYGYSSNNWQSTSSRNGRIELPALALLKIAAKCNELDDLRKSAETSNSLNKEANRDLLLLIRIAERDPKLIADLPKLTEEISASNNVSWECTLLRVCSDELADWPEAKKASFEVLKAAKVLTDRNPGNTYESLAVRTQILDRAIALRDTSEAKAAAHDLIDYMSIGMTNGGFDTDQANSIVTGLLSLNLTNECEQYLKTLKSTHNSNYRDWFEKAEAELALAKGEIANPQAIAAQDGEESGKTVIVWKIRSCPRNENEGAANLSQTEYPKLDGRFDLELLYLTPPNTIQRLALIPKAKAHGKWAGKLPPGIGSVQAILHGPNNKSYTGQWVPVSGNANLIANPMFSGLSQNTTGKDVQGWPEIANCHFSVTPGGIRPGGVQYNFKDDGNNDEITLGGNIIPIKPGKDYLECGWVLGNYVRLGRRYLDKNKHVISTVVSDSGNFQQYKWRFLSETFTNAKKTNGLRRIPKNTAFIQPVVTGRGELSLDGLYLTEIDQPADDQNGK